MEAKSFVEYEEGQGLITPGYSHNTFNGWAHPDTRRQFMV